VTRPGDLVKLPRRAVQYLTYVEMPPASDGALFGRLETGSTFYAGQIACVIHVTRASWALVLWPSHLGAPQLGFIHETFLCLAT
jgi:hypothetical protein